MRRFFCIISLWKSEHLILVRQLFSSLFEELCTWHFELTLTLISTKEGGWEQATKIIYHIWVGWLSCWTLFQGGFSELGLGLSMWACKGESQSTLIIPKHRKGPFWVMLSWTDWSGMMMQLWALTLMLYHFFFLSQVHASKCCCVDPISDKGIVFWTRKDEWPKDVTFRC